jgi:hypothetical protein
MQSRPDSVLPYEGTSWYQDADFRKYLFILCFVGILIRSYFCFAFTGLHWADEHQQYLEQAYRIVHGYGITFWEQVDGNRHPFYQTWLAVQLWIFEKLGLTDPIFLNGLIHWLQASALLIVTSLFFATLFQRGFKITAYLGILISAVWPNCVYVDSRILTDSALIAPMLLAWIVLPKRPGIAGCLLGLSFALRVQALLIGGAIGLWWIIQLIQNKPVNRSQFIKGCIGFVIGLLLVGLMDYLAYGRFYHSFRVALGKNLIEKVGVQIVGASPWYRYFEFLTIPTWYVFVASFLLAVSVVRKTWAWWLVILVFFGFHTNLEYKESRYIWTVLPFWVATVSYALECLYLRFDFKYQPLLRMIGLVLFAAASLLTSREIYWEHSPFTPTAKFLNQLRQTEDVKGVAIVGYHNSVTGNYWYLRKQIPLVIDLNKDPVQWLAQPAWKAGFINYVITSDEIAKTFPPGLLEPLATEGELILYRVVKPSVP